MLRDSYFRPFPTVLYANNIAVDITARTKLLETIKANPNIFYPLDINDGPRADQVAQSQYDDPYKSWILYYSNEIVDPYYQWYLQPNDFDEFLKKKYDVLSVTQLQNKIHFYRNNWYQGNNQITPATYEALAGSLKKYWEPVYTTSTNPNSYKRVEKDWIIQTNQIVQYTCNTALEFTNNEVLNVHFGANTGQGQIIFSNSTAVIIQHTADTVYQVSIPGGSYIYGNESQSNVVITGAVLIANNISQGEVPYWDAVTIYQYETEQNEYNKTIRVLDPRLLRSVTDQHQALLK